MSQSIFCPQCGYDNRGAAKFCKVCGSPLAGAAPPSLPPLPPTPPQTPMMFPQAASTSAWLVASNSQRYPVSSYTTIGRGTACTIVLPDSNVSTQHATITEAGGQWQIVDNNSRNGTWVNRMRITAPCSLHHNDELMIGVMTFRFESSSVSGGTTLIDSSQLPPMRPGPALPATPVVGVGGLSAPKARGRIKLPPQDRQDQPPTDWTRVSITALVTIAFIGALLTFFYAVAVVGGVLICLGGAVLIPILLLLWAPFQLIFSSILSALKDDKPVTVVNFQIDDEISGYPLDVTFVRKRGTGGGIAQGDVVEVWGQQQGGAAITASKIRVIEAQGRSTSRYIPIKQPWPAWILLVILAVIALGIFAILPK